jgi:hypothetical protein
LIAEILKKLHENPIGEIWFRFIYKTHAFPCDLTSSILSLKLIGIFIDHSFFPAKVIINLIQNLFSLQLANDFSP